jgi:hypothetical protein
MTQPGRQVVVAAGMHCLCRARHGATVAHYTRLIPAAAHVWTVAQVVLAAVATLLNKELSPDCCAPSSSTASCVVQLQPKLTHC